MQEDNIDKIKKNIEENKKAWQGYADLKLADMDSNQTRNKILKSIFDILELSVYVTERLNESSIRIENLTSQLKNWTKVLSILTIILIILTSILVILTIRYQ